MAAARKVSAAAIITLLPEALRDAASLPVLVVFPEPLTPSMRITVGFASRSSGAGAAESVSSTKARRSTFTSWLETARPRLISSRTRVTKAPAAAAPRSAAISTSSNSSSSASSTGRPTASTASRPSSRRSRVRRRP
jgi:hypothetical protein